MYVFNYYIPSGLFVVVSWVSLIIPPDAIPGRIALIITTFLVLVNIANTVFSSSPTADTINPIQVWILACIVFVFITVLEYAYILFMMRRVKQSSMSKSNKSKSKRKATLVPEATATKEAEQEEKAATNGHVTEMAWDEEEGKPEDRKKSLAESVKETFSKVRSSLGDVYQNYLGGVLYAVKEKIAYVPDEIMLQILMTNIDHFFFWLMIILFLLFNIVYWTYYVE